jgi:anti-sigma factor RsiW
VTVHEPDRAAAYVTGTMTPEERERFEAHLLTCETCWREVRLDRDGRRLAESVREAAPADLRESVRAAVLAAASDRVVSLPTPTRRRPDRLRGLAAVAAVLALVVAGALARSASSPSTIDAAMTAFAQSQVEAHHESMPAPDLGALGMARTGATDMQLGAIDVEAFAYRTDAGSRMTVFLADAPFPMPPGATPTLDGWDMSHDDMHLMTGDGSKPFLAISSDMALLTSLQHGLDLGMVQLA